MISYVGTFVLVHGFSALLPPIPEDEQDYYEIMKLPSNCSQDDIRKAYKKLSLQLHPDKVAQRREYSSAEEARLQYQNIQEAHAVLSNPSKRRRYDLLHKSPTRYQFISTGLNPSALYENLARANCCDKSRLVFLALLLCCFVLLQPILACAKLNQELRGQGVLSTTPWVVVLIPWWIVYGLVVVVQFVLLVVTKQVLFSVSFLEHAAWFVGQFFVVLKWDSTITWNYKLVFIPIYMALFFRWTHKYLRLRVIRNNLQRMVTLEFLERQVLGEGRHYPDLTEEEIHQLQQEYVVVHVPPFAASSLETEEEKIQASPEYEHAVTAYTSLVNSLISGMVVSTTFTACVVAKIDGAITASWWIVFVPIWVSLGFKILVGMYSCCCMPVVGEEIVGGEISLDEEKNDEFKDCAPDPSFESVEGSIQKKPAAAAAAKEETTSATSTTSTNAESKSNNDAKVDGPQTTTSINVPEEIKEEMKKEDLVEDIPADTTNTSNDEWSGIHMDDDMYREFQSAYEEAEESAMEAQAKSQANCCSAIFQLMMLCLIVGKLQRDYMRDENAKPGYNAFWILFPVFLVFGCALCTCACLVYTAGESESLDHLVERATHKDDDDDDDEESPSAKEDATDGDAAATPASNGDKPAEESKQEAGETKEQTVQLTEQDSEMHDLD